MGKSRKDYEKYLNSISPDRDDEAWIIGGKNRYCGRENYGTMIKRYDPIGFNVGYRECVELYKASEDKLYFRYMLFNLGIVDRWKRESEELIAELEKLCGKKWVNPYKPEEERFVLTLTDEERSLIEERIKAGHYSSENIEKRRVEAHKAKMAAKRAEICERYDKKIRQAEAEKKIMLCVFDYGLSTDNVIYYSHTNTLPFNWNGYGEKNHTGRV